ncbi:MAG: hypothetical protein AAF845_20660 [Bacteroidota bacterium]
MRPISLSVSPRRLAVFLFGTTAALVAGHVLFTMGSEVTGHPMYRLPRFFNLGGEANLPAYFSAAILLLAAGLLALTARTAETRWMRIGWVVLAAGFALMSLDEATLIHEGLVGSILLNQIGRGEGATYYRWYLLYIPLVVMIGALYVPFLLRLPRRLAGWFLAAAALFLGGAIGVEMVESTLAYTEASTIRIMVNQAIEEGAEMAGVSLFNVALVGHLARLGARLDLGFGAPEAAGPAGIPLHGAPEAPGTEAAARQLA